jgi:cbb3-type cytochrome oxidase maturation protein
MTKVDSILRKGSWAIVAVLMCLMAVPSASASHLSGGEPDLLALFAGIGLVLAFVGILHLLDLGVVHGPRGRKLGWTLVGLSIAVVIAGAVTIIWIQAADYAAHAADRAAHPETATAAPPDFWIKSILPLIGVAVIASLGAATAIWWASRSGQFTDAEDVKYRMLRDDDDTNRDA